MDDALACALQAEKNRAAAMANNLQKGNAGPMRLYVGSLHFNITEEMLRGIFEPFGRVSRLFPPPRWSVGTLPAARWRCGASWAEPGACSVSL